MNNTLTSATSNGQIAPATASRGAVRQEVIVRELRGQIVGGQFAPGHRLPSRLEIVRQFGASIMTVQRALETLRSDGFVIASRGDGTYVSEHPPHLSRIAVAFPSQPGRLDWSRFWAALSQEATALQDVSTLELPLYYGVDEHHDSEDYHRLVEDVCAHRLAGIIFAAPTFPFENTPLLDEPGIPRVAFASDKASGFPLITADGEALVEKALEFFHQQKRQRVAFIMASGAAETDEQLLCVAREAGLESHARWCHRVHRRYPATARNIAQLMFHPSPAERPDALFIGDDNLVEQATRGIADAGAQNDVSIVAHCNFPHPPVASVPVTWLGFDARQILAACLQSLDAQRQKQQTPDYTRIAAQFEDELTDFDYTSHAALNSADASGR